ncbi:M1 family metallopeptidase [Candidatus Saccharibacteria bacterium]|nr:M1 family metallopeptidase [Candidatus Saccharibacteria bacterium]
MQTVSRLLDRFIPTNYNLNLAIDRTGRTFQGTVILTGSSVNGQIAVHAHDLSITETTIDDQPAQFSYGQDDEVTISQDGLTPGDHTVTITYHGSITDSLHGLYPCYFTHGGQKKELLVTQFESHYAREVFPCIDEPAAKATFDVTVTTETGIAVLGNMPATSQNTIDDRLVTTFATTPRMSTYLLAIVMGELQSTSATTSQGVEVTVWATPVQKSKSLEFALEEAVKIIEFFDDYFGVPYPLPKADHVAVPDFSAGAMENWGLITYRETALIVDKTHSSINARQYVSAVIAHELSHQWFGNLVTMKWWNNLWLNESFASIMENIAPNALHPDWNVWLDFDAGSAVMAARRDAIDGVQSVQTDVHHPDEIQSIFDGAIVYSKGARLLRMMMEYIGEDAFRAGLKEYFTRFAYQNTDETDLWDCLDAASGKEIGSLMKAWISQPGYPVVTAHLDNNELTLRQSQFFIGPHNSRDQLWPIPLEAESPEVPTLLDTREAVVPYTGSSLLLNQHNSAHFITHYDEALLAALLDRLQRGELTTAQRLQLLNEQILLVRGGEVHPSTLIDILGAYQNESEEQVWDAIVMAINELKKFIENDKAAEKKLRTFVGELARTQFERLGWDKRDNESDNDIKLRTRIITEMIYSEDQAVITEGIRRARAQPLETLDPELRGLLVGVDVRYGENPELLTSLMERYQHEVSPDLKEDIRGAVTCVKDSASIERVLGMLTNTELIRPQDTTYWFIYMLINRYARERTWQWLRDNWTWIEKTFGSDKSYDYYPRYAGQFLMTRRQLQEYTDFFTPMLHNIGLKRVIEMGITDLQGRVDLIEKNQQAVCERLKQL